MSCVYKVPVCLAANGLLNLMLLTAVYIQSYDPIALLAIVL
jgi:hypothetical protein